MTSLQCTFRLRQSTPPIDSAVNQLRELPPEKTVDVSDSGSAAHTCCSGSAAIFLKGFLFGGIFVWRDLLEEVFWRFFGVFSE